MSDVILTIGGRPYTLPPVSFAALEAAWPIIGQITDAKDRIDQARMIIEIVAIIFADASPDLFKNAAPELTGDAVAQATVTIKRSLKGNEFVGLVRQVPAIFKAMGLAEVGEATPAATGSGQNASAN